MARPAPPKLPVAILAGSSAGQMWQRGVSRTPVHLLQRPLFDLSEEVCFKQQLREAKMLQTCLNWMLVIYDFI